jgi:hypothetical protein
MYKQHDDCRPVRCVCVQICRAVLPKSRGSVAEPTFSASQLLALVPARCQKC